jgi:hypothetical protein
MRTFFLRLLGPILIKFYGEHDISKFIDGLQSEKTDV